MAMGVESHPLAPARLVVMNRLRRCVASEGFRSWLFIEKTISAKRTHRKNVEAFGNKCVERKKSWVRSAKKAPV